MSHSLPQLVWLASREPSVLHARRHACQTRDLPSDARQDHVRLPSDDERCWTTAQWADQIVSCGIAQAANGGGDAELELRAGPLRELWRARGPGFLHQLLKQAGSAVAALPACSEIPCVGLLPLRGGDGYASPRHGGIAIEWLLTNVDDQLPEVLRLAHLVTQLVISSAQANQVLPTPELTREPISAPKPSPTTAPASPANSIQQVTSLLHAVPAWQLSPHECETVKAAVAQQAESAESSNSQLVGSPPAAWNRQEVIAVAAAIITLRLSDDLDWFPFTTASLNRAWQVWRLPTLTQQA